jgi:glycosyl transferase family 87
MPFLRFMSAFRRSSNLVKFFFMAAVFFHLLLIVNLRGKYLSDYSYDLNTFRAVRGIDFNAVYCAGLYARKGTNLYRVPTQDEGIPHTRFRYTPPVAYVIGVPFSFIRNFFIASRIWILINEILLCINILLTVRFCRDERKILPAIMMWLFFFPYAVELYMGQFSFLMGSFSFWSALALWKKRKKLAVFFWIPAILLKLFPIWLVPLFWKKAKPGITITGIFILFILIVPYFLTHPVDRKDFIQLNSQLGKEHSTTPYYGNMGFYNCLLQWKKVFPGISAKYLPHFVYTLSIGLIFLLAWFCFRNVNDVIVLYSTGIVIFFILSLELWEHHYVLLLPFFVLYYISRENQNSWKKVRIPFIFSYILCAMPSFYIFLNCSVPFAKKDFILTLKPLIEYLYLSTRTIGVIIFLFVLLHESLSSIRSDKVVKSNFNQETV